MIEGHLQRWFRSGPWLGGIRFGTTSSTRHCVGFRSRLTQRGQRPPAPPSHRDAVLRGSIHPCGDEGFRLETPDGDAWPVITLEPSVQAWMTTVQEPTDVALRGILNPWGPWLRVTGWG